MPHSVSGGGIPQGGVKVTEQKLPHALVLRDVQVVEKKYEVRIPDVKFVKEKQIKYNTVEENTVKYMPVEEKTTRYVEDKQPTVKYIVQEVKTERPVLEDKPYERPVVTNKEYVIASIKDMENVRILMDAMPKLIKGLPRITDFNYGIYVDSGSQIFHSAPTTKIIYSGSITADRYENTAKSGHYN